MRSTLGKDFSDTLQKTIDSRLPWKSQDLYPRVDIFGKDMLKNEDHQAALEDPVYQTMSRLNLSPSHVEPQIDKVKLTDAQFYW